MTKEVKEVQPRASPLIQRSLNHKRRCPGRTQDWTHKIRTKLSRRNWDFESTRDIEELRTNIRSLVSLDFDPQSAERILYWFSRGILEGAIDGRFYRVPAREGYEIKLYHFQKPELEYQEIAPQPWNLLLHGLYHGHCKVCNELVLVYGITLKTSQEVRRGYFSIEHGQLRFDFITPEEIIKALAPGFRI